MSFLTKLFGKPKKKINLPVTEVGGSTAPADKPVQEAKSTETTLRKPEPEKKPEAKPDSTGTTLRKPEQAPAPLQKKKGPELTALEMAKRQDWEVKTLPVWKPGDVILDTYEIEDVISGGMGHVYIANHNKWRVKLAIKSPNEMMLSDRDFFARILREANSWTELGLHPNIAYCYYVRNIEDVPHIVVEYVDGGNLRQWIEDGQCIDYRINLDLAIQFCHGMEYAHSKGMIHRDIKPENVLMTRDGALKITDFGLVRGDGTSKVAIGKGKESSNKQPVHGLTTIGTHMGTEGYMAPEQAASASQVDERADIFSFGVCLYEMFCGNKPYGITYGKKQEAPDPVELSGDDQFPSDIAAVLTKCVQWEPKDRYLNFKEIRQELSKIYSSLFDEESLYAELDLLDLEADGLNNRGVAYFELDRKEDAITYWEKALEINKTHLEATYNLSLVQWRNGKIPEDEVLQRIDNCGNHPSVDKERLAELKAYIHAERFAPDEAQEVLKDIPGRYEQLFSKKDIGRIRYLRTMKGHTGSVSSVVITPDGKYVVSGSRDKTLRLWDLHTGQCLRTMEGHTGILNSVALTSDGQYAVSGGGYKDNTLRMWDLKTGECMRTMEGHTGSVLSVALTSDGQYAVSGGGYKDNTLRMWDLKTGECMRTMEGHTGSVLSVALTSDGQYAVSRSDDKTLRVWDLHTGQCLRTMEGHTGEVTSVVLTPDGKHAVSGSWNNTLRVWDLHTGRCLRTMEGHTGILNSVALTSDGQYAVSGSDDRTLRVWDLHTGQCLRTMEGHTGEVTSVVLTPDGKHAVSGSWNNTLRVWDLHTGRCLRTMEGHTGILNSVALTSDGQYAVSGSDDRTLRLWEISMDKSYKSEVMPCLPKGFEQRKKEIEDLKKAIASTKEYYKKGDYTKSFAILFKAWKDSNFSHNEDIDRLYSMLMQKGRIKGLVFCFQKKLLKGHTNYVLSVALTSDGQYAVSGSWDETLRVWDLHTGQCLRTMEGHTSSISSVAITPDGKYVVSGSRDKTLRVWDLHTGQCLRTMKGHTGSVFSVAITPDGKYVVSGSRDKTLRLWDLHTGQCLRTMEGHTGEVTSVVLTPDGKHAVSGSWDKTLRVWDLKTGECMRTMEGHTGSVLSVALTSDGQYAVSGGGHKDNTLRMWDLHTGRCLRTMEGHTGILNSVALTSDGQYAVSRSDDKTLRVWDLHTGQCLRTMEGHTGEVTSVVLTPDGKHAVSGSWDKTLRVWEFIWDLEF